MTVSCHFKGWGTT